MTRACLTTAFTEHGRVALGVGLGFVRPASAPTRARRSKRIGQDARVPGIEATAAKGHAGQRPRGYQQIRPSRCSAAVATGSSGCGQDARVPRPRAPKRSTERATGAEASRRRRWCGPALRSRGACCLGEGQVSPIADTQQELARPAVHTRRPLTHSRSSAQRTTASAILIASAYCNSETRSCRLG